MAGASLGAAQDDEWVTIRCRVALALSSRFVLDRFNRMRFRCMFASMLVASRVWAQDAGDMATARTLGTEGLRLAESGDCAGAVEKLTRAEKLHHAPTTL